MIYINRYILIQNIISLNICQWIVDYCPDCHYPIKFIICEDKYKLRVFLDSGCHCHVTPYEEKDIDDIIEFIQKQEEDEQVMNQHLKYFGLGFIM